MAPGWYFKKGKPRKVFPSKYNIRPKVRGSTMTPVAKVMAEQLDPSKAREEGHAVLYRQRNRPRGVYLDVSADRKELYFVDTEVIPPTIFGEYRHVPRSKRPPIVNAIHARLEEKLQALNPRRTAFTYWNHIVPIDERFRKLFYFFSGREGFFVERDYIQNRIRMSRDYETSSARVLIQREQWNRITWQYVEVTASVEPPD